MGECVHSQSIGSVGRVERRGVTVEAANGDGELSRLFGDHAMLGRGVTVTAGFSGLELGRALVIQKATIKRVTLTATRLTIEAE